MVAIYHRSSRDDIQVKKSGELDLRIWIRELSGCQILFLCNAIMPQTPRRLTFDAKDTLPCSLSSPTKINERDTNLKYMEVVS